MEPIIQVISGAQQGQRLSQRRLGRQRGVVPSYPSRVRVKVRVRVWVRFSVRVTGSGDDYCMFDKTAEDTSPAGGAAGSGQQPDLCQSH